MEFHNNAIQFNGIERMTCVEKHKRENSLSIDEVAAAAASNGRAGR
jgi:hypothetical protein